MTKLITRFHFHRVSKKHRLTWLRPHGVLQGHHRHAWLLPHVILQCHHHRRYSLKQQSAHPPSKPSQRSWSKTRLQDHTPDIYNNNVLQPKTVTHASAHRGPQTSVPARNLLHGLGHHLADHHSRPRSHLRHRYANIVTHTLRPKPSVYPKVTSMHPRKHASMCIPGSK